MVMIGCAAIARKISAGRPKRATNRPSGRMSAAVIQPCRTATKPSAMSR